MQAVFIELPAFERHREDYLEDEELIQLQIALMANPTAGDVIGEPAVFANCGWPTLAEERANAVVCA